MLRPACCDQNVKVGRSVDAMPVSPAGIGWGVAAARAPTLLTHRGSALESGQTPA